MFGNFHITHEKDPSVGNLNLGEEPPKRAIGSQSQGGGDHKAQLPHFTDGETGSAKLTNLPEAKGLLAGPRPSEFFSFPQQLTEPFSLFDP